VKTENSGSDPFPFRVTVKRFEITDAILALRTSEQEETTTRSFRIDRFDSALEYGKALHLSILDSSLTLNTPEALTIAMNGKVLFDPVTTGIEVEHLIIQDGSSVVNWMEIAGSSKRNRSSIAESNSTALISVISVEECVFRAFPKAKHRVTSVCPVPCRAAASDITSSERGSSGNKRTAGFDAPEFRVALRAVSET